MSTLEVLSIIKDISLSVAAGVTAYVALTGLGRWEKELNGKANFDVARELARSVYALRDGIAYCRSPFAEAQEFPEGYDALEAQSSEKEGQAWAHVYAKRWEPVGKAVRAFDTATFEAEALWGNDVKQKATDLRKCVRSLQVGIEAFIRNQYSGGENFQDRKFAEKIESVIWDFKAEENEFTQRIDKAIEEIELVIRPHLSR